MCKKKYCLIAKCGCRRYEGYVFNNSRVPDNDLRQWLDEDNRRHIAVLHCVVRCGCRRNAEVMNAAAAYPMVGAYDNMLDSPGDAWRGLSSAHIVSYQSVKLACLIFLSKFGLIFHFQISLICLNTIRFCFPVKGKEYNKLQFPFRTILSFYSNSMRQNILCHCSFPENLRSRE